MLSNKFFVSFYPALLEYIIPTYLIIIKHMSFRQITSVIGKTMDKASAKLGLASCVKLIHCNSKPILGRM